MSWSPVYMTAATCRQLLAILTAVRGEPDSQEVTAAPLSFRAAWGGRWVRLVYGELCVGYTSTSARLSVKDALRDQPLALAGRVLERWEEMEQELGGSLRG